MALKEIKDYEKLLIDQVVLSVRLIQVNPATSASGQRSFSTARRMKTWICSKMSQERFNNICVLHINKSRLDNLGLVGVANQFIGLNENHQ